MKPMTGDEQKAALGNVRRIPRDVDMFTGEVVTKPPKRGNGSHVKLKPVGIEKPVVPGMASYAGEGQRGSAAKIAAGSVGLWCAVPMETLRTRKPRKPACVQRSCWAEFRRCALTSSSAPLASFSRRLNPNLASITFTKMERRSMGTDALSADRNSEQEGLAEALPRAK